VVAYRRGSDALCEVIATKADNKVSSDNDSNVCIASCPVGLAVRLLRR
jgi:hypothetical protein